MPTEGQPHDEGLTLTFFPTVRRCSGRWDVPEPFVPPSLIIAVILGESPVGGFGVPCRSGVPKADIGEICPLAGADFSCISGDVGSI